MGRCTEYTKEPSEKIKLLETRIRHLTNELFLTKEEHAITLNKYYTIYSNLEKIIDERTKALKKSEEKYRRIFENI